MGLTAAQIVSLSCQTAKVPGWTSQAGQLLNNILQSLCQNHDFEVARGGLAIQLTGSAGPYNLPADYLRVWQREGVTELYYTINGVPYHPTQISQAEYGALVFTAGLSNFPQAFCTNQAAAPPTVSFWPPPNGAYIINGYYQRLMPDIVTPESSATVPWFPNTDYLQTKLSGELMKIADDDRWEAFLSSNADQHPSGAGVLLREYLRMKSDEEGRAKTVSLDPRRFRPYAGGLRNTKLVGW